jgi:multiple sugar transport system substrate-binding protein
MSIRKFLTGLTAGAGICALAALAPAAAAEFDGVTINVMTFTGPQIAEPLQRRAPDFEKATGAKVNVITVPFSDLYQKLLTDWTTGTNSVDAAVFAPQWMVDYVTPGLLEDISDRVAKDEAIKLDDIAPFFREFSQKFNGKTYMLTLDGDFQMVYYRTDVAKDLGLNPPQTWDDYLAFAKAAHGKDLNGDGKADFGSCIAKKRNAQSYWMIISVASAFLQSKGTSQGAFFKTEDLQPLYGQNEAFAEALRIYSETTKYGPPDEINLDVGDTRNLFTSGQCALSIDWGDIGTLAIDKEKSKFIDKVGAVVLPGSKRVLDRETGKLVDCTPEICPHAKDGINHAPFAAFGGWSGGINAKADPKVKDAAYAFFSWMSQPEHSNEDVTIGITGFNPYRLSQFQNLELWTKAGMSEQAAKDYLGAIQESLNSPNMVLDLRIPQNQRYEQVALDTAIARLLAGELDIEGAMKDVAASWNEITDELSRDEQLSAYKSTIGAQ